MHYLNKYFDKVFCINLLERKDKKEKIAARFKKLDIDVEWFTAVTYGFTHKIVPFLVDNKICYFNRQYPNEFGAALSHYTVIKKALLNDYDQIFVFEDDALFDKNFNDKIPNYLDALPNDANMCMLYSFMFKILPQNIRVNKYWMKSYKAWSLMAYGMDKKMMKAYIQSQDQMFMISDHVTFQLQERSKLNIYSAIPSICIPDTEIGSNIRNDMNYENTGGLGKTRSITNLGIPNENYE